MLLTVGLESYFTLNYLAGSGGAAADEKSPNELEAGTALGPAAWKSAKSSSATGAVTAPDGAVPDTAAGFMPTMDAGAILFT